MSSTFPNYKAGDWSFENPEIAEKFDTHVREHLPWYDLATGVVKHLVQHYLPQGGLMVDAGASTGNIGRAVASILSKRDAQLVPFDNSESMKEVYCGPGDLRLGDIRTFDFDHLSPDIIVCFLTLMFVPVAERAQVIRNMISALRPGGALIIFDKMCQGHGHAASAIYRLTLAAKYEAGARSEDIIRKELSLAGVQRPMSLSELDGFHPVFRFGDFAGWLIEKTSKGGGADG